jgi:hypothetical protein
MFPLFLSKAWIISPFFGKTAPGRAINAVFSYRFPEGEKKHRISGKKEAFEMKASL